MNNQKKKETKKRERPSCKNSKEFKRDGPEWFTSKKHGEIDACDCLSAKCPGCWYPCETCGSNKCSAFCRTIRRDEQLEWKKSE